MFSLYYEQCYNLVCIISSLNKYIYKNEINTDGKFNMVTTDKHMIVVNNCSRNFRINVSSW